MSLLQVNTIRSKNGSSAPYFDRGVNVAGISTLGIVEISSGIITSRSSVGIVTYYGDGRYLKNIKVDSLDNLFVGIATVGTLNADNINANNGYFTGIVTSLGGFEGDGSRLTGVGVAVTTTPPSNPSNGDLWYNPTYARTFVWYEESSVGIGSTSYWVDSSPLVSGGENQVAISTTPPSNPSNGDLWYNPTYARTFIWYNESSIGVGSTASWVDSSPFTLDSLPILNINTTGIITASSFSSTNGFNIDGDLVVSGDVTATNFRSTSDINLKKNIKPLDNSLDKIKGLNGVSFDWTTDDSSSIGFVAQEVEKIFPILVEEVEGIKTVNYIPLVAVLVESIKELSKEVEDLRNKLENS